MAAAALASAKEEVAEVEVYLGEVVGRLVAEAVARAEAGVKQEAAEGSLVWRRLGQARLEEAFGVVQFLDKHFQESAGGKIA